MSAIILLPFYVYVYNVFKVFKRLIQTYSRRMAIATSDDGLRATSQQTHRVSTSDGTRKEGIGVEGLVRGGRLEGEERGRRGATAPLTPPKLLDNIDTKQVQGV